MHMFCAGKRPCRITSHQVWLEGSPEKCIGHSAFCAILCTIRTNHPGLCTDLANAPSADCAHTFNDSMGYGNDDFAMCNSIFKDDTNFVVVVCLSVGVPTSTIVVV